LIKKLHNFSINVIIFGYEIEAIGEDADYLQTQKVKDFIKDTLDNEVEKISAKISASYVSVPSTKSISEEFSKFSNYDMNND
jgi:hypothetical protein